MFNGKIHYFYGPFSSSQTVSHSQRVLQNGTGLGFGMFQHLPTFPIQGSPHHPRPVHRSIDEFHRQGPLRHLGSCQARAMGSLCVAVTKLCQSYAKGTKAAVATIFRI